MGCFFFIWLLWGISVGLQSGNWSMAVIGAIALVIHTARSGKRRRKEHATREELAERHARVRPRYGEFEEAEEIPRVTIEQTPIPSVTVAPAIPAADLAEQHTHRAWARAAEKLYLIFDKPDRFVKPTILGEINGHGIEVKTVTRGLDEKAAFHTRYTVTYKHPLGLGLEVARHGVLAALAKKSDSRDIVIGEPDFDAAHLIRGDDPAEIARFITPARRMKIAKLLAEYPVAVVGDEKVEWEHKGIEDESENIVRTIQRMVHVARHLTNPSATGPEKELDGEAEAASEPEATAPPIAVDSATPEPEDVEERVDLKSLEAEMTEMAPARSDADDLFDEFIVDGDDRGSETDEAPATDHAADDEIKEALDSVQRPAEEAERQPTETPSEPPPDPTEAEAEPEIPLETAAASAAQSPAQPTETIGLHLILGDLFQSEYTNFQTADIFEARFKDKPVRATGILTEARSFSYDMVFGTDTATKAILEIGEAAGPFGSGKVQAVVRLPPEAEEALKDKIGAEVTVSGTFVSCDAFMRNLFVGDGEIV